MLGTNAFIGGVSVPQTRVAAVGELIALQNTVDVDESKPGMIR